MFDLILASAQIERLFWARPLPTMAMFAVFAAVIALSIYLYRRPWGLKPWQRILLGVARLIVLALIVAFLFEPMAVVRETYTQQRGLPVLIDVSESMSVRDPRKGPEDLAEAAAALDLLDADASGDVVLNLDVKQRHAIAAASRPDLATSLLSQSGRSVFESIGGGVDVSYHAFGANTRMISDDNELSSKKLDE
ncbi:MAG: hypothetical protein HN350_21695, partial [Phycisphaerales bacterium]|nr:hypothetical protein [Phycisphaerales bacterium]